jgi:hypothetical protein
VNKQTIITILFALVAVAGQGQEIKKVAATPEDFMEHMAMYGYEVFTYDISSLRDSVSGFTIVVREYNQTGMINEEKSSHFRTCIMISDFNEEDQKEIYATKGAADDIEHGIFRLSKVITVGFSPVQLDSIENVTLRTSRIQSMTLPLTQKPIPGISKPTYQYRAVPYQPSAFCLNTFIPLVLYCSYWWDNGVYRCCGDAEMTEEKEKDSNFFKYCPHYYIIGAIFHK